MKDDKNLFAIDYCKEETMRNLYLRKHSFFNKNSGNENVKIIIINSKNLILLKPFFLGNNKKPNLIIGLLYKNGQKLVYKHQVRFLVIDPYIGVLIRFKKRSDFPLKPKYYSKNIALNFFYYLIIFTEKFCL